jgi:splicing factor 3B subunit 2
MALTTAERNRRKRERKKKERDAEEQKQQVAPANPDNGVLQDVEIEYVAAELPVVEDANNNEALEALRRFQARAAAAVVSSDETDGVTSATKANAVDDDNDHDEDERLLSKRKLRDMIRPTVADLKRRVKRPDLVEAHDVTAPDPEFLIRLKAVPGSVPVPRHWGRKRKYLQGKRGFEKQPFQLPAFLVNTGITELRDTVMESENEMSAKQKNRSRVQVKLGAIDVDYRTLHDAFFKHQTKPSNLTRFGDLYYEGKELEVTRKIQVGKPLSAALRAALGMNSATSPPPWLLNMQRYGPPPSYPLLKIPGLNAPLPDPACQYGYHPNGWGKPPVDPYGRPLYGGNPFDPPGSTRDESVQYGDLVTSDGKTAAKADWGALPTGDMGADKEEEEESSSSEGEMEESSAEEEEEEEQEYPTDGMESTLPPPSFPSTTAPVDLRKTGTETPMSVAAGAAAPPKQLYTVIEQKQAAAAGNAVFASEIAYAVPTAAVVPEGAESVLSKAMPAKESKRKGKEDDDDEDLGKNFKF